MAAAAVRALRVVAESTPAIRTIADNTFKLGTVGSILAESRVILSHLCLSPDPNMKRVRLTFLISLSFFCAAVCFAQGSDFDSAFVGGIGGLGGNFQKTPFSLSGGTWAAGTHTSAYSIGYRQQLNKTFSGAVTYVNQGHYDRHGYRTQHHSRDDIQAEILMGYRPKRGPLEFKIGAGGAYYSETDQTGEGDDEFENHQGFGLVVSGVIDVDLSNRLFLEGRVDRHLVPGRYDSTNALLGVGVRLQTGNRWEFSGSESSPEDKPSKHAVRLNFGLGRLNSKQSETLQHAFQLSHEFTLSRRFGLATSYLREGAAPELNRHGIAIQGVAKQELAGVLTLGLALGPYFNVDRSDFFHRKGELSLDALFTAFLDVKVTKQIEIGISTSRPRSLTTLKNKPMTDVFQAGFKFRF